MLFFLEYCIEQCVFLRYKPNKKNKITLALLDRLQKAPSL